MKLRLKRPVLLMALLLAVPVGYGTIHSLAGGILDALTHSTDSGRQSMVNGAGANVTLVGTDHVSTDGANGAGATMYVGMIDPIETQSTRNAVEEWRGYR